MPNITFVHPDGAREELEIAEGRSIMQGATTQGVEGIVAECGGNCMCATCHVYVEPTQLALLPPMSEDEDAPPAHDSAPFGDAEIAEDLGTSAADLLGMCGHEGTLPIDVLVAVCEKAGCGEAFDDLRA